mmetsp:Transcript_29241/g.59815  ORF Transcript_29241/g.59815 Transcript_29241/m.59815 type:complete len:228 (+) Transcript_29241:101-784(+)
MASAAGGPKFHPSCGYATKESRMEWYRDQGLPAPSGDAKPTSEELTANPDRSHPLYYWQLFSLLGYDRIEMLVRKFYERVLADASNPHFQHAFTRIGDLEHHVETQTNFWVDSMGGGAMYHGSLYRLNFHHEHNARQVMNAEGATLWMNHMGTTLKELEPVFRAIDPRIPACIVTFLETKMKKYSEQFGWRFNQRDFDVSKAEGVGFDIALAKATSASADAGASVSP